MVVEFIILVILSGIKAIFSAADTAFLYLNKSKISQESKKNKKALKIKNMIEKNHRFYGVIEVGITVVEFFASVYALEVFVKPLANQFILYGMKETTAVFIAILIITIVLAYFLLVFGAIIPKRIARNHPEKTSYRLIGSIYILSIINYPFEKLIHASTKLVCSIFGINTEDKHSLTEKEIKMMILEGKDQGIVDKIEKDILLNALKFNDITVKKIMKQKDEIDFIDIEEDRKEILDNIKKYKYTRIPVFEGDKDHVIGILNMKDIMIQSAEKGSLDFDIRRLLREPMFVSKEEKIPYAFKSMQMNRQSLMMVLDDKEKIVGLITMEDIMERLVGKIFDEYDK